MATNLVRHVRGDVGIVDGVGRERSNVDRFVTQLFHQVDDFCSNGKTTMVGSDGNSHEVVSG